MLTIVQGFSVLRHPAPPITLETLYAVTPRGVFKTEERPYNNCFNVPTDAWTKVDAVPDFAHFVGNYPMPTNLKKVAL